MVIAQERALTHTHKAPFSPAFVTKHSSLFDIGSPQKKGTPAHVLCPVSLTVCLSVDERTCWKVGDA